MKRETLIQSSYEAAYLVNQGIEYQVVPRSNGRDVDFAFRADKRLDEARKRYEEDVDIQEFVDRHRRVKWTIWEALQGRNSNEAPRSRR